MPSKRLDLSTETFTSKHPIFVCFMAINNFSAFAIALVALKLVGAVTTSWLLILLVYLIPYMLFLVFIFIDYKKEGKSKDTINFKETELKIAQMIEARKNAEKARNTN